MGLFSNFRKWRKTNFEDAVTEMGLSDPKLLEWLGITGNREEMSEATYFTCIKVLSETIGKLPWKYFQDTKDGRIRAEPNDMAKLLSIRPNPYQTPSNFWSMAESTCQQYGNAFAYLQTAYSNQGLKRVGLWLMHPRDVRLWIDDRGLFGQKNALFYEYIEPKTGRSYRLDASEVLHFKTWYSRDGGVTGEPVKNILKDTIRSLESAQDVIASRYQNGLTASMVMQYTGELDDAKIRKLEKRFAERLTTPVNAGKVIPIPLGLSLTKLDQSFVDAQFYELKKYTAAQIAGAFGISPTFINDYDHASYSNSEAQQLQFLVNTMSPRIKMYEEEINYKCLLEAEKDRNYFYQLNTNALLRTDAKTQQEILTAYVNNGVYTPNEARRFLNMTDKKGGDILMCNGNYIPIEKVGEQYGGGD